jgi:hypothetical protein
MTDNFSAQRAEIRQPGQRPGNQFCRICLGEHWKFVKPQNLAAHWAAMSTILGQAGGISKSSKIPFAKKNDFLQSANRLEIMLDRNF